MSRFCFDSFDLDWSCHKVSPFYIDGEPGLNGGGCVACKKKDRVQEKTELFVQNIARWRPHEGATCVRCSWTEFNALGSAPEPATNTSGIFLSLPLNARLKQNCKNKSHACADSRNLDSKIRDGDVFVLTRRFWNLTLCGRLACYIRNQTFCSDSEHRQLLCGDSRYPCSDWTKRQGHVGGSKTCCKKQDHDTRGLEKLSNKQNVS